MPHFARPQSPVNATGQQGDYNRPEAAVVTGQAHGGRKAGGIIAQPVGPLQTPQPACHKNQPTNVPPGYW